MTRWARLLTSGKRTLWPRAGVAEGDQDLVAHVLARAADQNRYPARAARPLRAVPAGRGGGAARGGPRHYRPHQRVAPAAHHGGVGMTARASRSQPHGGGDGRAMPSRDQIRIGNPTIMLRNADLTACRARMRSDRTKSCLATPSCRLHSGSSAGIWGTLADRLPAMRNAPRRGANWEILAGWWTCAMLLSRPPGSGEVPGHTVNECRTPNRQFARTTLELVISKILQQELNAHM